MASLPRCTACGSFVVASACPSCGSGRVRRAKLGVLATLAGSSVFAMTLMACYGCPDGECGGDPYLRGPDASDRFDARSPAKPVINDGSADSDAELDASPDGSDAGDPDASDAAPDA